MMSGILVGWRMEKLPLYVRVNFSLVFSGFFVVMSTTPNVALEP